MTSTKKKNNGTVFAKMSYRVLRVKCEQIFIFIPLRKPNVIIMIMSIEGFFSVVVVAVVVASVSVVAVPDDPAVPCCQLHNTGEIEQFCLVSNSTAKSFSPNPAYSSYISTREVVLNLEND